MRDCRASRFTELAARRLRGECLVAAFPSADSVCDRNSGFRQEREHFVDCVLNDEEPLETGEDGRAGLSWPCEAPRHEAPLGLWLP